MYHTIKDLGLELYIDCVRICFDRPWILLARQQILVLLVEEANYTQFQFLRGWIAIDSKS